MRTWYDDITKILTKYSDILFGTSSTAFSEYKKDYPCALVFATPHKELLDIDNYTEEKFEYILNETYKRCTLIVEEIVEILKKYNIEYCIPPATQSNEETLIAPFSFKFAGILAGLGWIGKNDVLITEKYGPRVRLSAILIDVDPLSETPISANKCPPECTRCIEACPCHALHNRQWNITAKRDDLIDYHLCNRKRSLYLETHYRKNSCGLCMVACPIGLSNIA